MQNSNFIQALSKEDVSHTPIWLMRQAGRYMPQYREIRSKAGSFLNLCKNPELATTVTLQPINEFNLDAAILFSDILVIPEALGMELHFVENEGPKFTHSISNEKDLAQLSLDDLEIKLDYVFQTIGNVQSELKGRIPLIGFSGSPFTLLCYMIEGGSSKEFAKTKKLLYTNPSLCHQILEMLSHAVTRYLHKQIESGINTYMIFDTWGGILSSNSYSQFSLNYIDKIIKNLNQSFAKFPSIVFTKGGGVHLDKIAKVNPHVIGLDWTMDIANARKILPHHTLQGNLDPNILAYGDRDVIKQEVSQILNDHFLANARSINSHIFNLGHGILQTTPMDNVKYLVDLVHELSSKLK